MYKYKLMEDGIERSISSLTNKEEQHNGDKYLYFCIPIESCLSELKITFDRSKAMKFLKEKTYTVEIYIKNEENLYVTSYSSLLIDN
jgi:hypothetical protein